MSNPYYTRELNILFGQRASSDALTQEFARVEVAFDAVKVDVDGANTSADEAEVSAHEAADSAVAAAASAAQAEAAAATAAATAGATKWISGTTYAEGAAVWSPIDQQTYRRKTAGAGATDPALAPAVWTLLGGLSLAQAQAVALSF